MLAVCQTSGAVAERVGSIRPRYVRRVSVMWTVDDVVD